MLVCLNNLNYKKTKYKNVCSPLDSNKMLYLSQDVVACDVNRQNLHQAMTDCALHQFDVLQIFHIISEESPIQFCMKYWQDRYNMFFSDLVYQKNSTMRQADYLNMFAKIDLLQLNITLSRLPYFDNGDRSRIHYFFQRTIIMVISAMYVLVVIDIVHSPIAFFNLNFFNNQISQRKSNIINDLPKKTSINYLYVGLILFNDR